MISAKRSRPTRLRVASEGFGGTSARIIRRARSYASPFAGSFEVAHALAREGKRFENPLALDERYDLVVLSRLRIQWVPARPAAAPAAVRVGGAPGGALPQSLRHAPLLCGTPWRGESVAALIHAWRPALRWVHIAFPAASPLTASKDFVTWSAGEILSSADEKTATILESGAMTNVVRSVNA